MAAKNVHFSMADCTFKANNHVALLDIPYNNSWDYLRQFWHSAEFVQKEDKKKRMVTMISFFIGDSNASIGYDWSKNEGPNPLVVVPSAPIQADSRMSGDVKRILLALDHLSSEIVYLRSKVVDLEVEATTLASDGEEDDDDGADGAVEMIKGLDDDDEDDLSSPRFKNQTLGSSLLQQLGNHPRL
ncbi:hypothetical protein L6452_34477 [Arctium lappa]|uniref:Uncharacterized protein n=1 Tax=Arctium lappa TaxID=4217 RepID=A0ACB8YJV6_ARCLA|nr:hypothetical protein L6452_34477 [Arctium lappa]